MRSSGERQRAEIKTAERCWILEVSNDPTNPAVSIARARVEPGVTTQLHQLRGVDEHYLVLSGVGVARVGKRAPLNVRTGDVVIIPADTPQQITNLGPGDLVFYCVCTPRFTVECYESLEK